MQLVIESLDLLLVFADGIIELPALKISPVGHLPGRRLLLHRKAADPAGVFFIRFVPLSVHLDEAFDGKRIDNTQHAAMAVKKKRQADVIHAGRLHDKVIVGAGVLQDFGKASIVVTDVQMKKFTEVVLIANVQCGERDINAATGLFCFHFKTVFEVNASEL